MESFQGLTPTDWATWTGLVVAVIGFGITIFQVLRSRSAAEHAQAAAEESRHAVLELRSVQDFSSALAALEEVKRLHRSQAWNLLPDRYSALRKSLIGVRSGATELTDKDRIELQRTIQMLRDMEHEVDSALMDDSIPGDTSAWNQRVSKQLDALYEVLVVYSNRRTRVT